MALKVDDNLSWKEVSNKNIAARSSSTKLREREKDSETIKRLASDAVDLLDNVEMDDVQKMRDKEDRKNSFPKKWAGPLIVGAFVPAMYALILIFSGQIVLNSMGEMCFYPLNTLLSVEIVVSYLFLLVYSWIFLGDDIKIRISYLSIDWHLFAPYVSLELLVVFYSILGGITIILTIIGTYLLIIADSCMRTAAALYGYTLFTIFINWVGIITISTNLIKLKVKDIDPEAFLILKNRTATITEIEETMFLKKFRDFDPTKNGFITAEVLPRLLVAVNIELSEEELEMLLIEILDIDGTGLVQYTVMYPWYRDIVEPITGAKSVKYLKSGKSVIPVKSVKSTKSTHNEVLNNVEEE